MKMTGGGAYDGGTQTTTPGVIPLMFSIQGRIPSDNENLSV